MKLWDLETILEGSNENVGNASGAAGGSDSDDDNEEMDLDDSPPKPSKGKRETCKTLWNILKHVLEIVTSVFFYCLHRYQ